MILWLAAFGSTQAATFTTNFDTDPGTPVGNVVVEDSVLKLTVDQVGQRGSWIAPDFNAGALIGSFKATFKARIGGGTEKPAQGFSFVLAKDLSADAAFGEGGGSSRGLIVSFDTVDNFAGNNAEGNDPGDAPGIILKFGGAKVAAKRADNLKTDGRFVDVLVQLDPDGTLDVVYDGVKIYDNFAFAYTPISGNFALGAGTADANAVLRANHWIDDLSVTTAAVSGSYVSAASPAAQGTPPNAVIRIQLENLTSQTVQMTFDGASVTPTVTTAGTTTTVEYDPPGFLTSGSSHAVRLTYEGNKTFAMNFQVANYATVPASAAAAAGSINTGLSGFKVKIYQVAVPPTTDLASAEKQLAGLSGANLGNLDGANADGTFDQLLINFEQEGAEAGIFSAMTGFPDEVVPGMPGTTPDGNETRDNIALEVIGYLDLAAGAYTFGVNSDDGFRLAVGSDPRDVTALTLGIFDGARAAADSIFSFVVEQAGIYPVRFVWFEGGGGASVELFSVDSAGRKILLNDRNTAGSIKVYRERAATFKAPPYLSKASPAPGQTAVSTKPKIEITITEDQTALDNASIELKLNGSRVTPSVVKAGRLTTLTAEVGAALPGLSTQTIDLRLKDNAGNSLTRQWQFTTAESARAVVSNVNGYWTFDNGDLKANLGKDLEFIDPSLSSFYKFGTTGVGDLAEVPPINGQPAKVLVMPRVDEGDLWKKVGLRLKHGIAPNGGGRQVNQWTLIMDLYWADGPASAPVLRTHDLDQFDNDSDLFWRASDGAYGKGCCSTYDGIDPTHSHQRKTWARVVLAVDLAGSPRVFGKYINGFKHRDDVGGDGNALDSRYALLPEVFLFNEGDANQTGGAILNAIQIREGRMTDQEIAALGGPSASGIPLPAIVEAPVTGPKLSVSRNGLNLTISWDPLAAGFTLESADSVGSGAAWTSVPGTANNSVTIAIGSGSKFYRLRR